MSLRATVRFRSQQPEAVAVGLTFLLASGVLAALLGARLLSAGDYTVFAAFFGLFGVVVLGPATSLEQESVLRASTGGAGRPMLHRALLVWIVIAVLVLLPVAGWQSRLLGDQAAGALGALLAGAPVVLLVAVVRGLQLGRGAYRAVATTHVLAGLGTVLLPVALYAAGVRPLAAFVAGAAFAWVPAAGLLLLRHGQRSLPGRREEAFARATLWLVAANLLVLANLLAVPPLLRWHVLDIGAQPVADTQLLVSISRLTTTGVLAFLPLVLGRLGAAVRAGDRAVPTTSLLLATALGTVTALAIAVFGGEVVELITGRTSSLGWREHLLAGLPAAFLCPALVLMAVAVSRGSYASTCLAWGVGLFGLLATAAVDPQGSVGVLLTGILIASALPLLVLMARLLPAAR